jgi:hypothetical protein
VTTISQLSGDARTQQSNIYTLLIARMMGTSVLAVLHKATMIMVDCGKGMQDCAMQQPTKYLCCIEEASNNFGTTSLLTR